MREEKRDRREIEMVLICGAHSHVASAKPANKTTNGKEMNGLKR
jgi:hypothetical protein